MRAEWEAVARYRVFISGWYPTKKKVLLASGLRFAEAKERAALEYELLKQRDSNVRGYFADDRVDFELENKAELDEARRQRLEKTAACARADGISADAAPVGSAAAVEEGK